MPKLSFKPLKLLKAIMPVAVAAQFLCSCHTAYAPSYFMDVPPAVDTVVTTVAPYNVPKIKYGDILSLSVVPLDQMSNLYQAPVAGGVAYTSQTTQLSSPPSGNTFTVDKNGIVEIPLIGKVNLSGLTIDDAKSYYVKSMQFSIRASLLTSTL